MVCNMGMFTNWKPFCLVVVAYLTACDIARDLVFWFSLGAETAALVRPIQGASCKKLPNVSCSKWEDLRKVWTPFGTFMA